MSANAIQPARTLFPIDFLKRRLRQGLEHTPILSDYYAYHRLFPRTPNLYRGVFSTFTQASESVPKTISVGYNHTDLHNASLQHNLNEADIGRFKAIDYPVLVWLREAFAENSVVFDLGGSTGYSYYAYRKYIPYPTNLQWIICDVPEAVNVGNQLLARIDSPGLSYTTNLEDMKAADILLTCGALQYLEPSLAELINQQSAKPRHVIVHHVPFYQGEPYITVQNLWGSYTPYKIQNHEQFVASIEALNYELVDHWTIDRTCSIPFHPERFVDAYHGFYFRQPASTHRSF
ncbi:TIGR04325 family methyltransferase [Phormidesmis sp. 146-12]